MVNGNYVLYGDRPSSESEIVVDHVHRSVDRKTKRKANRTANELQHSLTMAQLDNDTDSIKYEKKIKEPRLLRYVPTTDVEENFVTEKFETYDLKPTEERPRRYVFTKKPKNPADGSVNYAYSRSSSSSPNGNLPTISEHGEQYGTYRLRPAPCPSDITSMTGYESKLEKYFTKPKNDKKLSAKGSHPDSLYRVPTSGTAGAADKMARVMRVLRWPAALLIVCIALAVFVYFLMPDNMTSDLEVVNGTYWETTAAAGTGASLHRSPGKTSHKSPDSKKTTSTKNSQKHGIKTPEIDFYGDDTDKRIELIPLIEINAEEKKPRKKLPIAPVFPEHIAPEVQYGNEKADTDKLRSGKKIDEWNGANPNTTVKPHITQKPEKPLAIYFKDAVTAPAHTETITRAETVNDFLFDEKQTMKTVEEQTWRYPARYEKPVEQSKVRDKIYDAESELPPEVQEYYNVQPGNFTSGHSKIFGIGIEDAEKMQSTTQSSLYNTRVSPTLPTWHDGDDFTTKKYPVNANYDGKSDVFVPVESARGFGDVPQCRSPRLALCRGVLPYDLAGPSATIGGADITTLLPQIEYLMATNCSERIRQFACALLEPECNPPPYPSKMPCHSLCKAVRDSCSGFIPKQLLPTFNCKQFSNNNCVVARSPCFEREIPCGDGTCIPRDWMCDGTRDCPKGEDEEPCITCTKDEFKCPNGGCILKRWVCDGYKDCPNGEDEEEKRCAGSGVWLREQGEPSRGEPGEEPAGSAPLPSIRRPNHLPDGLIAGVGENDSSKELLITSDSTNALKRNFTRRPSSSRLTPYRPKLRTTTTIGYQSQEEEQTHRPSTMRKFLPKLITTTLKSVQTQPINRESAEDVNIGDLGFFEELEDIKNFKSAGKKAGGQPPKEAPHREPMPVTPVQQQDITRIDKSQKNFERVFDGAAMLRKAAAAEAEEAAMTNYTSVPEKEDFPTDKGSGGISSHYSPCPSGELRCVDGRCITLAQLCDGTIDCSDHADEDNCYT